MQLSTFNHTGKKPYTYIGTDTLPYCLVLKGMHPSQATNLTILSQVKSTFNTNWVF